MAQRLLTERLVLRPWTTDDAPAALAAYGDEEVARWLIPAMDRVRDEAAMRLVLQQWVAEDARMLAPAGRWAIELSEDGRLIGGGPPLPRPPSSALQSCRGLHPPPWGPSDAPHLGPRPGRRGCPDWLVPGTIRGRPPHPR